MAKIIGKSGYHRWICQFIITEINLLQSNFKKLSQIAK